MLSRLTHSFRTLPQYIKEHPDFSFTLLLVLVVPIAFLYTGQQFLSVAADNQERLEKDKIGVLQDVFMQLVIANKDNPEYLQTQIDQLSELNPDITKFRVAKEVNNRIYIIAAAHQELRYTYEENIDLYNFSTLEQDDSLIFEYFSGDTRLWQAFRSVLTDTGENYFIFTETSFARTDQLFQQRIDNAYYWLSGVLLVLMYLAYRHLRLIDYGYLYREAQAAITTRDLFTNMVTHELRAPLTAMRGYASMIHENSDVDFAIREQALRIQQSSSRLLAIVNDLLEVARLQSGKMKVDFYETNICDVIKNTLNELESSAREKSVVLSSNIHTDECVLVTDEKRMAQVITNLVSNAIKYTENGTITVVLKVNAMDVEIRVQDTGMGISAADQKKLFAPFFRVDSSDVSQITGSGLGMWITKQLVSLLQGSIAVESIKNVGTHVVVTLPKKPK